MDTRVIEEILRDKGFLIGFASDDVVMVATLGHMSFCHIFPNGTVEFESNAPSPDDGDDFRLGADLLVRWRTIDELTLLMEEYRRMVYASREDTALTKGLSDFNFRVRKFDLNLPFGQRLVEVISRGWAA